MKQMKLRLFRNLVICVFGFFITACTSIPNTSKEPAELDLHGVEPIFGTAKFNFLSSSYINRDSRRLANPTPGLESVDSGSAGNWQWSIQAAPSVVPLVTSFSDQRVMMVGSGSSAHKLTVPSLEGAIREFHNFYRMIVGPRLLPLDLQLIIYPENVRVQVDKRLHSDNAIPMYFAFSIPEKVTIDGGAAYSWILDTLSIVGHEYWHAYNRENKDAVFMNKMTEEVTAYTLERCIRTALSNRQGTFHLIDIGGKPINMIDLETERKKIITGSGPIELSNAARTLSLYNMAYVLKSNVIKKDDIQLQEKLYGLCYAMVHNPVDITKGFYPPDQVTQMPYSG